MTNFSALGMRPHPLHPHAARLWLRIFAYAFSLATFPLADQASSKLSDRVFALFRIPWRLLFNLSVRT